MSKVESVKRIMKVIGIVVGIILVVFSVMSLVAFSVDDPVDVMLPFYYM